MITLLRAPWSAIERYLGMPEVPRIERPTSEDMAYAERKVHPDDRRRALAGRAALRIVAAHHRRRCGRPLEAMDIDRSCEHCGGGHGRPRSADLTLSTSTSAGQVLAGAADHPQNLGLDIEAVPERVDAGLIDFTLHPREQIGESAPQASTVLRHWAQKEAVLKATGHGITHPPHRLLIGSEQRGSTLRDARGAERELRWRPVVEAESSEIRRQWVCSLPPEAGYAAALSARHPVDVRVIDPLGALLPAPVPAGGR